MPIGARNHQPCLVMLRGIDTPGRRCGARPLIGEQYALKALQVLLTQE